MWVAIFQRIVIDFFLDFLYFPIWWYTGGARWLLLHCADWISSANMQFAPGVWLRNLFVPMFGQYDWQGRIVSFFIRLANVVARAVALSIWVAIIVIVFFVWILIPAAWCFLFFAALF